MPHELTEYKKRYLYESEWVNQHYSELFNKYRDKIIAVDNHKVIAYGDDGEQVMERARKKLGRECTFVTLITDGLSFKLFFRW